MNIAKCIATFGGCGLSPKAPGTVGSLAALVVALPLLKKPRILATSALVAGVVGLWASKKAGDGEDHNWIVIDEIAGMWISLLACAPLSTDARVGRWGKMKWPLLAFGLFRLFDIQKPGPVGVLDRRHDAIGIMGDDIVAGVMAAGCIHFLRTVGKTVKLHEG